MPSRFVCRKLNSGIGRLVCCLVTYSLGTSESIHPGSRRCVSNSHLDSELDLVGYSATNPVEAGHLTAPIGLVDHLALMLALVEKCSQEDAIMAHL